MDLELSAQITSCLPPVCLAICRLHPNKGINLPALEMNDGYSRNQLPAHATHDLGIRVQTSLGAGGNAQEPRIPSICKRFCAECLQARKENSPRRGERIRVPQEFQRPIMSQTMLFDEELLTLCEAAKALPAVGGCRIHTSTLWRWSTKGVKGVRLETRRLGGRIFTSREALERFATALAEAGSPHREGHSMARARTSARRAKDVAAANAELDAAGCGEIR
jgi:hypothetical protein